MKVRDILNNRGSIRRAQPPNDDNYDYDDDIPPIECSRDTLLKGSVMIITFWYLFYTTLVDSGGADSFVIERVVVEANTASPWGNVTNDYCLSSTAITLWDDVTSNNDNICYLESGCYGNCHVSDRRRNSELVKDVKISSTGEVVITSFIGLSSVVVISLNDDPLPSIPNWSIYGDSCKSPSATTHYPPVFTSIISNCLVTQTAVFRGAHSLPRVIKISVFDFPLSADRFPRAPTVVTSNYYPILV